MSSQEQDRIRLAEAMGYVTTRHCQEWHGPVWEGKAPNGDHIWRLPDPFTDANDCEAVMETLYSKGYSVDIHASEKSALVTIKALDNRPRLSWHCDDNNWKVGVCKLALSVLGGRDT